MKKLSIIFGIILLALVSCKDNTKTEICDQCDGIFSKTMIMQVDNDYFPCNDGTKDKCIHVQFSSVIDENAWQPFKQDICGFDFVPGYRYELSVKRKKIGTDSNGNPIYKYCLISIDSKTQDYLK
jgi:hypothetical protein